MTDPEPLLTDVHAHFLPDRYVDAARAAGIDPPDGIPAWPHWSEDEQLTMMDRLGIGRAMLSISSPGVHFGDDAAARDLARHVNTAGAELHHRRPDRFGHFASLPLPDVDAALAEIGHALDVLGADGVAIETNAAGRYPGDPLFAPVWDELQRREAVVFVHPTSPPGWAATALGRPRPMLEFPFDTTRAVSDLIFSGVLARCPATKIVIPHGGAALPLLGHRMDLVRDLFDPSSGPGVVEQLGSLWYDMAGTPFPVQIPTLGQVVGLDHVLYGSDYCFTPVGAVAEQVASIRDAPAPEGTTWRALTARNAARLLGRA